MGSRYAIARHLTYDVIAQPQGGHIRRQWSRLDGRLKNHEKRIWEIVSRSPLRSLWNLQGVPLRVVARRTWQGLWKDRVFGHSAELGFYFLFALFPTLLCASSILGLYARSADQFYNHLLVHMALVIPKAALGTVLSTFNEMTAAATPGKVTIGLLAAVWSASVGISAIQDTLNAVYCIEDTRSYLKARIEAIGLTFLVTAIVTLSLASMLLGDYIAAAVDRSVPQLFLRGAIDGVAGFACWLAAGGLLSLAFAVLYYWAPDWKTRRWQWLTPGATIGMLGWLLASLGLRLYLHFFNTYTVTYGSLGAVIILLMWFYISGLMLLLGAEINSRIQASVAERMLAMGPPADREVAGTVPSRETPGPVSPDPPPES